MGTRADRPDDLVRLCGGKDELDVRRRLLDELQQGIEACRGHHMGFVDDVDLEATADRGKESPLSQIASIVDTAVAGRVDLDDIDTSRAVTRQVAAGLALTARYCPRTLLTVQRSSEDPGGCRLAAAARTREQVRVIDPVVRQRSLQWLSDVLLTDDLGERVWSVAAVERERGCRGWAWRGLVKQHLVLRVLDPVESRL